jgi:hypothetical protein
MSMVEMPVDFKESLPVRVGPGRRRSKLSIVGTYCIHTIEVSSKIEKCISVTP